MHVTSDSPPRLWRTAALLGVASQLLFAFRLTTPHKLVFDEVHYVPAARHLLALDQPVNIEHPLVGKEIIAAGIALFGDDPLGWRFCSTLAGTATVLGIFALAWLIFGRLRTATLAGLFTLLNITVFIQARIAMLDAFLAAFVLTGLAAFVWSMRAPPGKAWPRWLLGSVLLGLATGAKWAAAPFVAYVALGLIVIRLIDARDERRSVYAALNGRDQRHGPGLPVVPAIIVLGCVSIAVYCLTFAPAFFYAQHPLTIDGFVAFQREMYAEQTQILPSHPYQSAWWSWPLVVRPIWYLYEPADGAVRGILMLGNPAILWGGLTAVVACLWTWWRDRTRTLLGVALLWAASYAMWIIIPKSLGFFYYYYLSSILLALPLAGICQHYATGKLKEWDEYYLAMTAGVFAYFYPIIAAMPLAGSQSFHHWMWFRTWP